MPAVCCVLGSLLGSCGAVDQTFPAPALKQGQRIILLFPHSGSSGPVNCKNHIEIRGSGIRCGMGLWDGVPQLCRNTLESKSL